MLNYRIKKVGSSERNISPVKQKKSYKYTIIILLLHMLSCSNTDNSDRELIIYYNGCDNFEITYDLDLSVQNQETLLEGLNVKMIRDTVADRCGYELTKGNDKKSYDGVMTDVDLMLIMKEFFK